MTSKPVPVKNNSNKASKAMLAILGAGLIEKEELTKIEGIYKENLKETFTIKYYNIYEATSSEKVTEKEFTFDLLPAIDPVLTYTGGSGNLRGTPSIPEIKPGIPIRTVLKHKNINILGGKNVIQTIGVETKFINLVGAFVTTKSNTSSSYSQAKKFDEHVVQPGLEITLTLNTQAKDPKSKSKLTQTNISLKGIISDFKMYAIREDKTYYGISIIISKIELKDLEPKTEPDQSNNNESNNSNDSSGSGQSDKPKPSPAPLTPTTDTDEQDKTLSAQAEKIYSEVSNELSTNYLLTKYSDLQKALNYVKPSLEKINNIIKRIKSSNYKKRAQYYYYKVELSVYYYTYQSIYHLLDANFTKEQIKNLLNKALSTVKKLIPLAKFTINAESNLKANKEIKSDIEQDLKKL